MRTARRACLVALIALAFFGCGGPSLQELRTRFAFETGCPEDRITTTQLRGANNPTAPGHGAQYGVSGCGERAVYVYDYNRGWMNDTRGGEEAASTAE